MKKHFTFAYLCVLCALCVGKAFSTPSINNVTIAQDAATKKVTITYDLSEEAIVTAAFTVGGAALPVPPRLAGDVNHLVTAGTGKAIVWNPSLDWPLQSAANVSATVSAWTKDVPPDYMVVKLFDDAVGAKRWYYATADDIPGGVTNRLYKSDYLLMRRIPAKGIKSRLGNDSTRTIAGPKSQTHLVSFTNDWYMAVYEFTEAQYAYVGGGRSAGPYFTGADYADEHPYLPMTGIFWKNHLRGNVSATAAPTSASLLGKLRTLTGITTFDLPTDAQWEYSCRAKTATTLNDGTDTAWNGAGVDNMNRVAWSNKNAGGRPHEVGLKKPNGWGLYDMLGKVWEWCRDWHGAYPDGNAVDPKGPTTGSIRVLRGGSWYIDARFCRSACRNFLDPSGSNFYVGFRLALAP
ncbi:MAG: formylglycine-generating enzyme family protein, partial [Kiritimatiellae bacterium]|nr:formylglycine-generating enzyme family protein [Kiritimatiellia bacterium]